MRVLWLCNVALPMAAEQFHMEGSNKEGWISGLADTVLKEQQENKISLAVAFPVPTGVLPKGMDVCRKTVRIGGAVLDCYAFLENIRQAHVYERALEARMRKIIEDAKPDIVHCFGTEYPHTLAMCRIFPRKESLLVGLQGLCTLYAKAYFADMPGSVIRSVTLRDLLCRDSIVQQQAKFALRGRTEREALLLAGNVTGRTKWDRENSKLWNADANYFHMNETLRPEFYGPVWEEENCIPHSIFVSQGDYPLKGLHYMLCAMPMLLKKYPDTKLYVAGDSIIQRQTLKQKLKISGYGKYLRKLIKENHLEDRVVFLGRLNAAQMRDRYLKSSLFVCCSALENSPNSLGEAMLLGMPCVSADVGGISSMFTHGEDGILYEGHRMEPEEVEKNDINNACDNDEKRMIFIAKSLEQAVSSMWERPDKMREYCRNARKHAEITHKKEANYDTMKRIYARIILAKSDGKSDEKSADLQNQEKGIE